MIVAVHEGAYTFLRLPPPREVKLHDGILDFYVRDYENSFTRAYEARGYRWLGSRSRKTGG